MSGTSFCIVAVQEFIGMLPQYFKGRTLGSFVRQLNMYNFHKVKGQKHRHVFRHPFFKRGDEDSLRNIRRKHVGKELRVKTESEKEMHPWNALMADKLGKLREVLDIMARQNQDLVSINNRMVNELQTLKGAWQLKSKDLIGLTSALVHGESPKLRENVRAFMADLGLDGNARPLLTSADVLACLHSTQGDQFKNEMNIFFVTEQLTSLYKAASGRATSTELLAKQHKVTNPDGLCTAHSATGGSTLHHSSGFTGDSSVQCGEDRACNSVDDISTFDVCESQLDCQSRSLDFFARLSERAEFDAFMADAFDSLSADECYLFMEES